MRCIVNGVDHCSDLLRQCRQTQEEVVEETAGVIINDLQVVLVMTALACKEIVIVHIQQSDVIENGIRDDVGQGRLLQKLLNACTRLLKRGKEPCVQQGLGNTAQPHFDLGSNETTVSHSVLATECQKLLQELMSEQNLVVEVQHTELQAVKISPVIMTSCPFYSHMWNNP